MFPGRLERVFGSKRRGGVFDRVEMKVDPMEIVLLLESHVSFSRPEASNKKLSLLILILFIVILLMEV